MERVTKTRGDDWGIVVDITGVDISAASTTFQAQARAHPDAEPAYDFTCTKSGEVAGRVDCTLPAEITQGMNKNSYFWDLEMIKDGTVQTILPLQILVNKDVTRGN
ncbi:MAG: hypothetical protein LC650_00900 [Actinobacteria bacterium]|nr:hypothetical protein [Actinomycetota bacterium]